MKTFTYRPFLKFMMFLPLLMVVLVDTFVLALATLSIILRMVEFGFTELTTNLPSILGIFVFVSCFTFLGILPHLIFPDVQIRETDFRIKTLVYQSKWLRWSEVIAVKEHWRSSRRLRMFGLHVQGISPLYSIIGFSQLVGFRAFFIRSDLIGYEELIALLLEKCPHLELSQERFF